jgi:Gas vesicle synthesis protein GvpL/GvpF
MCADPGTAVWLYTVTSRQVRLADTRVRGVDGEQVRILRAGALAAVVGLVERRRFTAEVLQQRLGDLDELARLARAHHQVIEVVAQRQPVVPARLATIYLDEAAAHAALREHADDLTRQLDWLRSRLELGVKAYHTANTDPATAAPKAASGAAYLRARQAELASTQSRQAAVDARAGALYGELAGMAVAAHQHRPQDRRLSGDARPMVLNAAYLVDEDRARPFIERVQAWARDSGDLTVEVTGPWPPYSFAAIEAQS